MVTSRKQRALRKFQQNFFAHSNAAGRVVRNETNDTPQPTRQEQQRKHTSFKAESSGRLAASSVYYTIPHSPAKRQFEESDLQDAHNDEFDFSSLNSFNEDLCDASTESHAQKRPAGDNPLSVWTSDADLFLLEFLHLEGRGDFAQATCFCGKANPMFRCEDCHGTDLMCHTCTLCVHERQPLHRIECWNGTSFQVTMLKALGVRFQLGHPIGIQCINPKSASNNDFVVLDCNGVHEVGLDFCGCRSAQPHITQLLRVRLFPSTTTDPKSAATFSSVWEFYNTVARLTDNTGIRVLKNRYESFLCMVREWCFIMQMKRCGQGHHPGGIKKIEAGTCAVLCPACPHPSKNLPVGWENAPLEFQFLYALFLAIDTNFRLVRRNVSSDAVDPGLNRGYAFFVEETEYKDILASRNRVGNAQEKSTCSSHSAVNLADTRASRGLAATGAGTIDCAWHHFKCPCSVGDLQKGERYINMDYLFFSSMRSSHSIHVLNISYDIACQWNKYLWSRMSAFPHKYHLNHNEKVITFLVPKFHLPAHIARCQTRFSFNFIKGVGRTDGEAPERGWADINPLATSTREMGPGSRQDTIDDHFNDWNWKKVCAMGAILLRKYKAAVPEAEECARDLDKFEAALDTDQLAGWRTDIEMWELDRSLPNPFEVKAGATVTQAAVHLALSKTEAEEIEHGEHMSLDDDVSPLVLVSLGIELEADLALPRRCVEFEGKSIRQHATDTQNVKILQHVNTLRRRIDTWSCVQLLYMPCVSRLRSLHDITSEDKVHKLNLFLPLLLPSSFPCDVHLLRYEWALREAQANDALSDLRTVINMTYHLYKYKDAFVQGQCANTRAQGIIHSAESQIDAISVKYTAARDALVMLASKLGKNDDWRRILKPLDRIKDAVPLKHDEGKTVGQQNVSWIWKTAGVSNNLEEGLQDSLHVEWCKARARAHWWEEEVLLLHEEMRRVLAFFEWQAGWWDKQGARRQFVSHEFTEGALAYAHHQATLRRRMSTHFRSLWEAVPSWTPASVAMPFTCTP
ncbi:hypothetical protein C8R48DRAFT_745161 [Suillus tomentosus]|nr:hypothetical protein C8R48DRAFT_745161 [Suillus tomentosus]